MQVRASTLRLTATALAATLAVLGLARDPGVTRPVVTPAILDVTFSPNHLRAGKTFEVTVHTTPDITSLEACVMKYRLAVPKTGAGVFYASARVPWWARVFHGTFRVTFVGADRAGGQAQMEADVHI
jgi:hypothetical protein